MTSCLIIEIAFFSIINKKDYCVLTEAATVEIVVCLIQLYDIRGKEPKLKCQYHTNHLPQKVDCQLAFCLHLPFFFLHVNRLEK